MDILPAEPEASDAELSAQHWHWLLAHENGLMEGLTPEGDTAVTGRILAARCADGHMHWKPETLERVLALASALHLPEVIKAVHARAENAEYPDGDALEALAELGDVDANRRLFTLRYGQMVAATSVNSSDL